MGRFYTEIRSVPQFPEFRPPPVTAAIRSGVWRNTMGKTTAEIEPADHEQREPTPASDPLPIALDFLHACRDEGRPLALVSGSPGTGKAMLVRRFLNDVDDASVAHLRNPTNDPHAFLEMLLGEFGFDAFESTTSELVRLTDVYMSHESRKGCRPVVIVEDVQDFGPGVWDKIRDLAMPTPHEKPTALFVLTCSPGFETEEFAPAFDSVYSLDVTVRTSAFSLQPDCAALEVFFQGRPLSLRRLDQQRTAIGRNGANDVHINGPFVSRFHAVVAKEEGGIHIVDLQSTNGTFVNGVRVKRQRLNAGDVISIEDFTLRFVDPDQAEGQSAGSDGSDELVMQAPLDHLLDKPA